MRPSGRLLSEQTAPVVVAAAAKARPDLEGNIQVQAQLSFEPISVEPLDTDGHLLRLQCSPTAHVAVASRVVRFECLTGDRPTEVKLDILSASHRVTVGHAGNPEIFETVACGAAEANDDALPASHKWSTPEWEMHFVSSLELGHAAVDAAAARIRELASLPTALVARFPGHPLALTALETSTSPNSTTGQLSWRSWHLYPGNGAVESHVVMTETSARPVKAQALKTASALQRAEQKAR